MSKPVSRNRLRGFSQRRKFHTVKEVKNYLENEKIQCLICGRKYKGLAGHLRIHDILADEYKERFGIPWTYGLVGIGTFELLSEIAKDRIENGIVEPFSKEHPGCSIKGIQRKRCAATISTANKNIQIRNDKMGYDGSYIRQRALAPKRGTPEHHEMSKNRPQCHSKETLHRLRTMWIGKKRNGERGKMINGVNL